MELDSQQADADFSNWLFCSLDFFDLDSSEGLVVCFSDSDFFFGCGFQGLRTTQEQFWFWEGTW